MASSSLMLFLLVLWDSLKININSYKSLWPKTAKTKIFISRICYLRSFLSIDRVVLQNHPKHHAKASSFAPSIEQKFELNNLFYVTTNK